MKHVQAQTIHSKEGQLSGLQGQIYVRSSFLFQLSQYLPTETQSSHNPPPRNGRWGTPPHSHHQLYNNFKFQWHISFFNSSWNTVSTWFQHQTADDISSQSLQPMLPAHKNRIITTVMIISQCQIPIHQLFYHSPQTPPLMLVTFYQQ
jgi:hypothetical protein